jgi:phenylalanyl-tRNA synthetase beta chain
MEIVTWSFTDSKIDKQFSKGEKEIPIYNPISSDLDVLRRSIFSNLAIYLKKIKIEDTKTYLYLK